MIEISVRSSLDGSLEKSLLHIPHRESNDPMPLLVGLHTWSNNRFNHINNLLPHTQPRGWALLLPEFRGKNLDSNPRALEAGGSLLAMQDVVDAIEYVCQNQPDDSPIDRSKIFLLGGSGGGHMSLMMAGYRPDLFNAISSWCPITDLAAWHHESPRYRSHITAVCGGNPGDDMTIDARYRDKSPMSHLRKIARANLAVHHGRHDTSVPHTHTVKLSNAIEALNPEHFYYEIFDGGHEIRFLRAFEWLDQFTQIDDDTHTQLTG